MTKTNLTTNSWIPVEGGYASLDDIFHGEKRYARLMINGHANRMNVFRLLRSIWYRIVQTQGFSESDMVRLSRDPEAIRSAYESYMATPRTVGGSVRDSFDVIEGEYPFLQSKEFFAVSGKNIGSKLLDSYDWEIDREEAERSKQTHNPVLGIGTSGGGDDPMLTKLALSVLGNYLTSYNKDSASATSEGVVLSPFDCGVANASTSVGSLTFDLGDLLRSVIASSRFVANPDDTAPWEEPEVFGSFFHEDMFLKPARGTVSAYFFPLRAVRIVADESGEYRVIRAANNQASKGEILAFARAMREASGGESDSTGEANVRNFPIFLTGHSGGRYAEFLCTTPSGEVDVKFPAWTVLGSNFLIADKRQAGNQHTVDRDSFHIRHFTDTLYRISKTKDGEGERAVIFDPANGGWTALAAIARSLQEGQERTPFEWANQFLDDDESLAVEYTLVVAAKNNSAGAYTVYSRTELTSSLAAGVVANGGADSTVGATLVGVDRLLRNATLHLLDREVHGAIHPTKPDGGVPSGIMKRATENIDRSMQRIIRESESSSDFLSKSRDAVILAFEDATGMVRQSYPPAALLSKRTVGKDKKRTAISVLSEINSYVRKAMSDAPTMMEAEEKSEEGVS